MSAYVFLRALPCSPGEAHISEEELSALKKQTFDPLGDVVLSANTVFPEKLEVTRNSSSFRTDANQF